MKEQSIEQAGFDYVLSSLTAVVGSAEVKTIGNRHHSSQACVIELAL